MKLLWLMLISLPLFLACSTAEKYISKPIIIAHRGAPGYLPEHTLAGVSLAHAWNIDYIEPDVVMTKDNKLVVLHDIHLDLTTDVRAKFPKRARKDKRYYVIDFSLKEIKTLAVTERFDPRTNKSFYPNRFPHGKSNFFVPTLREYLELLQGLNQTRHKNIGIYLEIKKPEFYKKEGKDITAKVVEVLKSFHYLGATQGTSKKNKIYIQCFDPNTLKRLRSEFKLKIPLVQLIAENSWKESSANYDAMRTKEGLAKIAVYAQGIGPYLKHLYRYKRGGIILTNLVASAHKVGLVVHPYTHRIDDLPPGFSSSEELLNFLFHKVRVDGVFSDFADKAAKAR